MKRIVQTLLAALLLVPLSGIARGEEAVLTIRATPSKNGRIVAEVDADTKLNVERTESLADEDWYFVVEEGGGASGWIRKSEFSADESVIFAAPVKKSACVRAATPILRDPDAEAAVMLQLEEGTQVEVQEFGEDYVYIRAELYEGSLSAEGWVAMSDLDFKEALKEETPIASDRTVAAEPIGIQPPEKEPISTEMTLEEVELHVSPSISSRFVARLKKGTQVNVYVEEQVGDAQWVYVSTESPDNAGWTEREVLMGSVTQRLNVRQGPGTQYECVNLYEKGQTVRILEVDGEWAHTADGWIHRNYVEEATVPTLVDMANIRNGVVTKTTLNIRSSPGSSSNFLGLYAQGDNIMLLEMQDGWGRTALGWVNLQYVDLEE